MSVTINGIKFTKIQGVNYKYDYYKIADDITNKRVDELSLLRNLILNDLWFLVYFVMGVSIANHKFVVDYCREIEEGEKDYTLDLAAREHMKTTLLSKAEVIQKILANREERIGIFSHTRPAAKAILRSIKLLLQESSILKKCFPDILFVDPEKMSPKWSEDDGLIVRRLGYYNESSVEAWGLLEGMPTGKHFTHRVYDDIETADIVSNPETISKLKNMFFLSHNLGTMNGTHRVIGTTYHHAGILQYLRELKDDKGKSVYSIRLKPATDNGLPNGNPVFLPIEKLNRLRSTDSYSFNCQQLLNPTPETIKRLPPELLKTIEHRFIPKNCVKFMVIDPAGDSKDGKGDSWAILVIAVDMNVDDIGASNIYIVDAIISPMRDAEAIEQIVRMYINAGVIMQVGIEKVGLSSVEVHVANALSARGRYISVENGSLKILKPAGRNKIQRIYQALEWPLNNSKIFISSKVPNVYKDKIIMEMDKFPYWKHDDALDALSYVYDMIKDYNIGYISNDIYSKIKNISILQSYAGY